jgi:hypothetical protein
LVTVKSTGHGTARRTDVPRVTTCNAYDGALVEERLCGTTNVQGRDLNGEDLDVCSEAPSRASERFLHLEQSLSVRARWPAVIDALDRIVPRIDEVD